MEKMTCKEYRETLKRVGFSYLGSTKANPKVVKNAVVGNVLTYSISLLQGNLSGHEVCAAAIDSPCRDLCLGFSGRAKSSILAYGIEQSQLVRARSRKTRLFFEERDTFMRLLCYEVDSAKAYAKKCNMTFAIRLNCMSDISPLLFHFSGSKRNILEMYPDVTFYDYTKDFTRYKVADRYKNYSITFSYDGKNWDKCVDMLERGYNIAVVFESEVLPALWRGYKVIEMATTDLRFLDVKDNDGKGLVGHLHFHRPVSTYKNGKYTRPNTPFVVMEDDPDIIYAFKYPKSTEE